MIAVEFVFLISLGVLIVLTAINYFKDYQEKQQLENAFYQLLENQNGQISLIQLAATARVDAEIAQKYLERQAKIFSATLEVDADGDSFYRFPKIRRSSQ
ncbi:MAG: hypothetical protein N3E45_08395 [Oscillatoriaceae bacterium SKW80]|nr:hypothetical protein [Oscillatoriaceae bacterium SKYG93]MCX8120839.1 hypothetical protein [Oscillatoriaceae bacterium SKW80]MDW8454180.1 hypothetical protein [Oscillatoriaceae cyanobacterium SKYGB_i_bin93]HIK26495.1 hypothetical protein [Oscillatoriaceae cyanobacterium M7585_C2015_266]